MAIFGSTAPAPLPGNGTAATLWTGGRREREGGREGWGGVREGGRGGGWGGGGERVGQGEGGGRKWGEGQGSVGVIGVKEGG